MGIYGDKKDYEELMKENMDKARVLYGLSESDQKIVNELLIKKQKIREKNGFFATFQINQINKKIEKIRLSSKS